MKCVLVVALLIALDKCQLIQSIAGIINLGNTCYMNSVLQSLYNVEAFRNDVIALGSNPIPNRRALFELYSLFRNLEEGILGDTRPLVSLLGVNPNIQEDAQEFLLKIFEILDDSFQSNDSAVEGPPTKSFRGEMIQYITCDDVAYKKERRERFFDISVDVGNGVDTLEEAFDELFTPCELTGENRYRTPDHGLQNAKKGQKISILPDVLYVHLKRFSFNPSTGALEKLSHVMRFPLELNMEKYLHENFRDICSNDGCSASASDYLLHSVLVHEGSATSGHYKCFAHCNFESQKWLELNDGIVSDISLDRMIEESIGGPPKATSTFQINRGISKNAYILQYVRKSSLRH